MFSNFLYFLVALVIYTTSDLFDKTSTPDPDGLVYSLILGLFFAMVCQFSFKRLAYRAAGNPAAGLDHAISNTVTRLSVLALMVFAANIYLYRLNFLVTDLPVFERLPTLGALLFLALFLFYLVIVWNAAYGVQKRYFPGELSKKAFIFSNISFSLPALLPWFCLSLFADLIGFLPDSSLKAFFNTPAGEIGYILLFLAAVSLFGPVLIKTVWRCAPLEKGYARNRIERVCGQAGLAYADILRWDLFGGTMITAGVMGLVGRFRYILVTPALLHSLSDDEMDAVMLHEIGHVQRHHMLFYLFFFAGFIACNFVFFEPVILLLYIAEPLHNGLTFIGLPPDSIHPILVCTILISCFVLYFRFGFGLFMRNFERQADLHVFRFSSDATPLIRTFYKIASLSRQSMDKPNWHHFSIGQRIRFLERCQTNPVLIGEHHCRVRRMIGWYAVIVLMVFGLGYSINYGPLKEGFSNFIAEKVLVQQLAVDPDNSDLYVFVGDYYYGKNAFQKARDAYENVIRIDPENVHALNNLAWLLTTCPDTAMRDYEKALELASRALAVQRQSFILDTYAEALWANNRPEEALLAAREALATADDKLDYYREQVARFKDGGKRPETGGR